MTWHAGSVRARVWQQLRLGALTATEAKAALPGVKAKGIETALYNLKAEGYAELREGRYVLTPTMPPLPLEAQQHPDQVTAVELVDDCPGGIDEWLLSFELKVATRRVQALLAEPIAEHRVRRIELPGGVIRYMPAEATT